MTGPYPTRFWNPATSAWDGFKPGAKGATGDKGATGANEPLLVDNWFHGLGSANQTATNGVVAGIAGQTAQADSGPARVTIGSNRVTASEAGIYLVSSIAVLTASPNASRCFIELASSVSGHPVYRSGGVWDAVLSVTGMFQLAAADYVTIRMYQNSGANMTISTWHVWAMLIDLTP